MTPLAGIRVVSLAINVPGPVAAARLAALGAAVTKVEPSGGDPLAIASPAWYAELHARQRVTRLDLKEAQGRAALGDLLTPADLLLTASRPTALARLGLDWPRLHARFPRLVQVAIVGHAPPDAERPGHDLTYLAGAGLLAPPAVPRTLFADLAGAERTVSAALGLLFGRLRGGGAGYAAVALADVAAELAAPLRHGLTDPDGALGGEGARYNLYRTQQGWLAIAALEPRFRDGLARELGIACLDRATLAAIFLTRTATEWEQWGKERDLPLAAVREADDLTPRPPLHDDGEGEQHGKDSEARSQARERERVTPRHEDGEGPGVRSAPTVR